MTESDTVTAASSATQHFRAAIEGCVDGAALIRAIGPLLRQAGPVQGAFQQALKDAVLRFEFPPNAMRLATTQLGGSLVNSVSAAGSAGGQPSTAEPSAAAASGEHRSSGSRLPRFAAR